MRGSAGRPVHGKSGAKGVVVISKLIGAGWPLFPALLRIIYI
jgi:hypothetical protein